MAARGQVAESDKDDVLKLLQATLISSKAGVPLEKLNREYRNLVGESIPYRNFGFGNLQEFLQDAQNVCRVNFGPDGSAMVHGLGSEDTFHIHDMVKRQNSSKKLKPQRRPLNPQQQQWQPPTSDDYSNQTASGFRHGFRPVSFPGHQNGGFRPQMGANRYPDQRNMSGSGRFQSGGRGARLPNGGFSQQASRLRTPQNGQPVSRGGFQQQPNPRPTSQRVGPVNGHGPVQSKPSQQSYIKILENYFGQLGLGLPEFKTSKLEKKVSNAGKSSKKGSTMTKFYSTIRVNNQSFQTYPTEYNTEREAEEAAAKLACDKLNLGSQNYPASQFVPSPPTSPADVSVDVLIDRIVELVGNRTNGVWSSQVELEYNEKFGQTLPTHWTERIETYQTRDSVKKRIHIERPIQYRCIIMPYVEQPSSPTPRSPSSPPSATTSNSTSPSAPSSAMPLQKSRGTSSAAVQLAAKTFYDARPRSQPKPPDLLLPDESLWDVYVTHIFSTVEVCVRLLGDDYSSKFEDLITDMELHYYDADKIPHVTQPVIGRLYAALVDGEWHRVEVVSLKGIEVTCYFIDHGGEHDVLNARVLREIEPKFLSLAPQAKRVRLAGLEEFAISPPALAELTVAALARSLVAKVHSRKGDQDISLILFDTSADEDININQMLLEKLKKMPGAIVSQAAVVTKDVPAPTTQSPTSEASRTLTASPTQEMDLMSVDLASLKPLIPAAIPEENSYFDIFVTLAASPSNFTVQPYQESAELERLMASMKKFYGDASKHHQMSPEDLLKDNFFAALHTDGLWYRVKINSQVDSCTLAVKIVDFGDFSLVPLENLQPLWPQFRNLPMQAINATLAGIVATDGDWTVDDTVWFARRVVNNAFVSVVKEVSYDKMDESIRIGVSLIDTNDPSKDIFIEKELVDSKRAAYLCI